MLHVISCYSLTTETAGHFVRSIQRGGQWYTLARSLAPDLIATDLLECQSSPMPPFLSRTSILFVCLDFWVSPEAYRRAFQRPAIQALLDARRQMASCAFELGAFGFPAAMDTETLAPPAAAWD